jgi:predicted phage baseplate assembly protein
LIEDANNVGIRASGSTVDSQLSLAGMPDPSLRLTPPLRALFDVLPVSRGKTAPREVLGSGDATIAGQEFVLGKSPLTYLQDENPASGEGYKSTLRVWVDGIEWREVAGFYNQPSDARIFVTREDDRAKTHVLFGDGENGARLPTGVSNVVASYRYGSGGEAPDAGTLTVILEPRPNLKAVRNPVAVGGGSDPDPPDRIRRYAPRSVLTFGRAVSGDDYETIAASAPGVVRARAYWAWNAQEQRGMVTVYVGDEQAAVDSAISALSQADDPNRPLVVHPATAVPIYLSLDLLIHPDREPKEVRARATAALVDSESGLFSANALRIGVPVYRSQIEAACLVPGTVAMHGLIVRTKHNGTWLEETGFRYLPGEGGFFKLDAANLSILVDGADDA